METERRVVPGMIHRLFLLAIPVAILLSACDDRGCIPVLLRAREAALVDAADLDESGLLHARLTARGKPLGDRDLSFSIERKSDVPWQRTTWVWVSTEQTDADGSATADLKRRDPGEVAKDLRATRWAVDFSGAGRYCGGSATESIREARLPEPRQAGPRTPAPVVLAPSPDEAPSEQMQPTSVQAKVPLLDVPGLG